MLHIYSMLFLHFSNLQIKVYGLANQSFENKHLGCVWASASDFNIFLFYKNTIWIGHKFSTLDRLSASFSTGPYILQDLVSHVYLFRYCQAEEHSHLRKRSNQIYIRTVFFFLAICSVARGFISHTVVFPIIAAVRAENTCRFLWHVQWNIMEFL